TWLTSRIFERAQSTWILGRRVLRVKSKTRGQCALAAEFRLLRAKRVSPSCNHPQSDPLYKRDVVLAFRSQEDTPVAELTCRLRRAGDFRTKQILDNASPPN